MAAKELIRVRGRFVDKVSKPIVKQLVDDLLQDGVLNDGEKEFVLEEQSGRADKASALIDIVKKKGDQASVKMITHLQVRDISLYNHLGLSCGPPAQPVEPSVPPKLIPTPGLSSGPPAQPLEQRWSTELITTSEAFWSEKVNDESVYRVTENNIKNRVALLITNMNFRIEKLNRDGAEKDEENMEKLLVSLHYEVVKYKNLTGKDMDEAVKKFSKHPKLKQTDSVFVVIMSHGKLGAVLGVNYTNEEADEFPIDNIFKYLGPNKCPALFNKPKIIIIQACRGEKEGSTMANVASDDLAGSGPDQLQIVDDALQYVHEEKDFLSLLSSTPGNKAYRDPLHGSYLIQYLVDVVNTCSHKDDIEELFRKVMRRFEKFACDKLRQMPSRDRCTLTRRFYLFPGH